MKENFKKHLHKWLKNIKTLQSISITWTKFKVICLSKLKDRVALPNRVWSVWIFKVFILWAFKDFYCRLTSDPFNFFRIFRNISAIYARWLSYLTKFLFVLGFIYFWKLKIRVALPNRVRSVWTLKPVFHQQIFSRETTFFLFLSFQLQPFGTNWT